MARTLGDDGVHPGSAVEVQSPGCDGCHVGYIRGLMYVGYIRSSCSCLPVLVDLQMRLWLMFQDPPWHLHEELTMRTMAYL